MGLFLHRHQFFSIDGIFFAMEGFKRLGIGNYFFAEKFKISVANNIKK